MNFKYILFTFILFAQSFEAHAYLDPGTGSLILQALFFPRRSENMVRSHQKTENKLWKYRDLEAQCRKLVLQNN